MLVVLCCVVVLLDLLCFVCGCGCYYFCVLLCWFCVIKLVVCVCVCVGVVFVCGSAAGLHEVPWFSVSL